MKECFKFCYQDQGRQGYLYGRSMINLVLFAHVGTIGTREWTSGARWIGKIFHCCRCKLFTVQRICDGARWSTVKMINDNHAPFPNVEKSSPNSIPPNTSLANYLHIWLDFKKGPSGSLWGGQRKELKVIWSILWSWLYTDQWGGAGGKKRCTFRPFLTLPLCAPILS